MFISNIKAGKDLESALKDINLDDCILADIISETWQLVSEGDLKLYYEIIKSRKMLILGKLIKRLYEPHPQRLNIVTTNYDRVIEYACDQVNVPIDKRFEGYYDKTFSSSPIKKKDVVNIIKVHGSLDLFRHTDGTVHSLPLQSNIPDGFVPEIVTPGENKYRSILTGESRDLIMIADQFMNEANCYLCVGYGFNDEQIQRNILNGIRQGKPIVVVTKELSQVAEQLISRTGEKYIIIQEDKKDKLKTDFYLQGEHNLIDGQYWSVEGFLSII